MLLCLFFFSFYLGVVFECLFEGAVLFPHSCHAMEECAEQNHELQSKEEDVIRL